MHAATVNHHQDSEHKHRVLVVGLGVTGLSCARFLQSRGYAVAVTDTRAEPPGLEVLQQEMPDVAVFLGGFDAGVFARVDEIVVSPGVSLQEPLIAEAMERGVPVCGDIELFTREARAPVIAITGSNGKSTVTTLVGIMAEQAGLRVGMGGNLGTPALDLLNDEVQLYVLELSSFQLEATYSLQADAAVVLNISADHMDRYRDLQHYADTKAVIYKDAAFTLINADDPMVTPMVSSPDCRFSLRDAADNQYGLRDLNGCVWLAKGDENLIPTDDLKIAGRHNWANALAALALAESIGLPRELCLETLRHFPGLSHRTQWVAEHSGVIWYNDSKATNVGAAIAALEGLDRPVVLIAGGQGKGADFSALSEVFEKRLRALVVMGEDAQYIADQAPAGLKVVHADNMDEAVLAAAGVAVFGDAVLLSPACASFDQYSGFAHRGDCFCEAVLAYVEGSL